MLSVVTTKSGPSEALPSKKSFVAWVPKTCPISIKINAWEPHRPPLSISTTHEPSNSSNEPPSSKICQWTQLKRRLDCSANNVLQICSFNAHFKAALPSSHVATPRSAIQRPAVLGSAILAESVPLMLEKWVPHTPDGFFVYWTNACTNNEEQGHENTYQ